MVAKEGEGGGEVRTAWSMSSWAGSRIHDDSEREKAEVDNASMAVYGI